MTIDASKTSLANAQESFVFIEAKVLGKPTRVTYPTCTDENCAVPWAAKPCSHGAEFHQIEKDGQIRGFSAYGMRWTKDHRIVFKTENRVKCDVEIPERTRENIAACAALGLGYWSERPSRIRKGRMVWAIDDQRRAHSIELNTDLRVAMHVCGKSWAVLNAGELQDCPDTDKSELYGIPSTMQLIYPKEDIVERNAREADRLRDEAYARIAAGEDMGDHLEQRLKDGCTPRPRAKKRTAPPKNPFTPGAPEKAQQGTVLTAPGMTFSSALKLLHHDPDYLGDIPTERLAEILDCEGEKQYFPRIRAELRGRK